MLADTSLWHQVGRDQGCYKHPIAHMTTHYESPLQQRIIPSNMPIVLMLRNLWLQSVEGIGIRSAGGEETRRTSKKI